MGCTEVVARLSAYLDGELARSEAGDVERHLADCARCRRRHGLLGAAQRAVRELPPETVSAGFEATLGERLAAERGNQRPSRHLRSHLLVLATGLAAGLAMVLFVSPGRRRVLETGGPRATPLVIPAVRWEGLDCGSTAPVAQCRIERPCASAAACGRDVGLDGRIPPR